MRDLNKMDDDYLTFYGDYFELLKKALADDRIKRVKFNDVTFVKVKDVAGTFWKVKLEEK